MGGAQHGLAGWKRRATSRLRAEYASLVTKVQVEALTVRRLLEKHVTSPVRFVQIDVEGFDDQVLEQLPLAVSRSGNSYGSSCEGVVATSSSNGCLRPAAVVFEYVLLGEARVAKAAARLHALGYRTCLEQQNIVAYTSEAARSIGGSAAHAMDKSASPPQSHASRRRPRPTPCGSCSSTRRPRR